MKNARFASFLPVSLSILLSALPAPPLTACATVSVDFAPPVYVQAETAVIIWDARHQIEHFIRQANISTQSPDLGFLVPTPEAPEIAEADSPIFALASDIGAPVKTAPVLRETPWQVLAPIAVGPGIQSAIEGADAPVFGLPKKTATTPQAENPDLLYRFQQDVAGYHVTTLDPKNTEAIAAWLRQNGYASTPALQAWLARYARAGWMINAFRLIKVEPSSSSLTTRAIRLSFHTREPYYPYSEPADRQQASAASPGGRVLHVAILSDRRMAAAKSDASAWPGQLTYAGISAPANGPLDPHRWLHLASLDDGKHPIPPVSELTTFVDHSNPRQGTADLYFNDSANASPFHATVVDPTLPTVRQIDWSNPVADLATLLALILIPGVPLYCAWLCYSRARAFQARIGLEGNWRPARLPNARYNKFTGLVAGIWVLVFSTQLMYHVVVGVIGRLGSSLAPGPSWPFWFSALFIDIPIAAALSATAGLIYAVMRRWRRRQAGPAAESARELVRKRRIQETYALAAIFVGAVGLALMVYVVLQLTA